MQFVKLVILSVGIWAL